MKIHIDLLQTYSELSVLNNFCDVANKKHLKQFP